MALGLTEVRAKLETMSEENWPKIRDELLARLSGNREVVVVEAEAIPA